MLQNTKFKAFTPFEFPKENKEEKRGWGLGKNSLSPHRE